MAEGVTTSLRAERSNPWPRKTRKHMNCFVACAPRNDDRGGLPLCVSSAPYRRHRHLLAPAGAAIDLLAGAELEVLVHADTHFAESRLLAGHGDRRTAQAGIGLDEGLLDLRGRNGLRRRQFEIFFRDLHGRTRFADGLEIGPSAQSRAGAVLVPFTED